MSQNQMILEHMQKNGSITQAEAINLFGCYRLGARIWELKQAGHKISRIMETAQNRYGIPVRYARYAIIGG